MKNKIMNEKEFPLPNEEEFNDEDILLDVMTSLKHLSTVYGTLIQEASNEDLSSRIEKNAKKISTLARDSFNLMFEKGWYGLEPQDCEKLCEEYNNFETKGQQFN